MSVRLYKLTVRYRQHRALHRIDGHFAPGSLTAVIGPNGAGKSTLLKSIAALVPVQGGCTSHSGLRIPAVQISPAGQRLAYLPQHSELDRSFPMTVQNCVALGLWHQCGAFGGTTQAMRQQVEAALHQVGLEGFASRPLGTLSSGQLQRALFARVVVQDAPLILLDEPFNAVDSKTSSALLALVLQWQRQGRTVIAVLHDDAKVKEHFPQTLLLARECIAWGPTADVLTDANLRRARAIAGAWDETAAACGIDGTLNDLAESARV